MEVAWAQFLQVNLNVMPVCSMLCIINASTIHIELLLRLTMLASKYLQHSVLVWDPWVSCYNVNSMLLKGLNLQQAY